MATPVGHVLAGAFVPWAEGVKPARSNVAVYAIAIFAAMAPDLDFIPGLLAGTPALYHQGFTHSLGAAIVFALIAGWGMHLLGWRFGCAVALTFLCYASHLGLDLFGVDHRPPPGIPLFWPISSAAFQSPVLILMGVRHSATASTSTAEWIAALFSWQNALAICVEVVVVTVLCVLVRPIVAYVGRRLGPGRESEGSTRAHQPD